MEKLKTALHYRADAVYMGGKNFGLRAYSDNFSDQEIFEAVSFAHKMDKKVFVALNIFAKNADFLLLKDYLQLLTEAKVDAVIVSDLGILSFVRANFPEMPIHLSTQANTTNKYAAKAIAEMGVERIVLARELSIPEIAEIREFLPPQVELEAFVHGAMCISYSGRCLLSNYLTDRDSNRGECVQACRWEYTITEKSRPNEQLEIQEDNRGTYILNSKDLNMIEHIDKLYKAGVYSFKIEGRIKTSYYVASVVNAYRRAIDVMLADPDNYRLPKILEGELYKTGNRKYTTGFYLGERDKQNPLSAVAEQSADFAALVLDYDEQTQTALVEMRNRFRTGDTLEILSPNDTFNRTLTVGEMTDTDGNPVQDAYKVQQRLYLRTEIPLKAHDILRRNREQA